MKALDFREVTLHEALRVRLNEANRLTEHISTALLDIATELKCDINKGTQELNWGDLGSLAHAVEQLEEAAMALGIEVENYDG